MIYSKITAVALCIVFQSIILFSSSTVYALSLSEAKHLLSRTGFGGNLQEIKQLRPLNRQQAVNTLLNSLSPELSVLPPPTITEIPAGYNKLKQATPETKKQFRKQQRARALELREWWFEQMLNTHSPFTEKLVMFWHNHFVSAINKVRFSRLMYQQQLVFRRYGLSNYKQLLHAVAKDPAMILYLDGIKNKKDRPNENFARELLELFTLGEGNYTEQDIKEVARAFTGWSVNRKTGTFVFRNKQHDHGTKHFLGRTGAFNGNDIIDIILEQPAAAIWICQKFWYEFISETPNDKLIKQWAEQFQHSDYDLKVLLQLILNSDAFWAQQNRGKMIKSPVELLVGLLRFFEIKHLQLKRLVLASRQLGQDIFNPPNVKGWPGGKDWITSTTLLKRQQLLKQFIRGKGMTGKNMTASPVESIMNKLNSFSKDIKQLEKLVLVIPPYHQTSTSDPELAMLHWLNDPVYQLK